MYELKLAAISIKLLREAANWVRFTYPSNKAGKPFELYAWCSSGMGDHLHSSRQAAGWPETSHAPTQDGQSRPFLPIHRKS